MLGKLAGVHNVDALLFQEHRHCGYPHRLLLPRGKPEGMVYQLYVVVSDYDKDIVSC
jgi:hypothetical protein